MRALLLAAAVWAVPLPSPAAPRLAVLAAANHGGPGTRPQRYAARDAGKLRDVLVELGGFAARDVLLVEEPDAEGLLAALAAVEARLAGLTAAERSRALLVLYYSGHAEGGHLLLGDERLEMADLKAALEASAAGVRLAFLDACGSGEMTRDKGVTRAPSFVVEAPPELARGLVILASSAHDESSQESDDLRGSFFTHYLATGLRGEADRAADGQVTLEEAYAYAYHRTVMRTAGTRGGTQHPTYTYDLKGNGEVVLTRLGVRAALELPEAAPPGEYLVYDVARDVVVAEVAKRKDRRHRLALAPGTYAVRRRAADQLYLLTVEVAEAGVTTLDPAHFAPIAFEDDLTKGPALLAAARAGRLRVAVDGRVGYQTFFDEPTRQELFHPLALGGVRLTLDNGLAPGWSLQADWAMGSARRTLTFSALTVLADFTAHVVGIGLRRDVGGDRWLLGAGPRLAMLYLRREFPDDPERPHQDLLTWSPGLAAEARLRVAGPVLLGLEARGHYLLYAEDGEDRSLGFLEAFLTLGVQL